MSMRVHPLTADRWNDLETIFNGRGCSVARGCWCMYYRRSGSSPASARSHAASRTGRSCDCRWERGSTIRADAGHSA